jgi:hypothetical protein
MKTIFAYCEYQHSPKSPLSLLCQEHRFTHDTPPSTLHQ